MALSLRGATALFQGTAALSFTPSLPAGWQAGDLLIIMGMNLATGVTFSQSGGTGSWTFAGTGDSNSAGAFSTFLAWRALMPGDTAPTFAMSAQHGYGYTCQGFTPDVNLWPLVDSRGSGDPLVITTAANSFTPNAASAVGAGEVSAVFTMAQRSANGTFTPSLTPPAGWTALAGAAAHSNGGPSAPARLVASAYLIGAGAGSVAPGAESVTDPGSGTYVANVYHAVIRQTLVPTSYGSHSVTGPSPSTTVTEGG